jgi:hypothetical protein
LSPAKRIWLLATAIFGANLLLRLPFALGVLGEMDAVNFMRGLESFDPLNNRPHLPGYPLFMALAKVLHALGVPAPEVLAWPGIIVGALGTGLLFVAVANHFSLWTGLLFAGLLTVLPGPWLIFEAPLSDGLGAGLAWSALALAVFARAPHARWPLALSAGLLAGLLPGARLSHFPFVLSALLLMGGLARKKQMAFIAGGIVGGVSWLLPMLFMAGPGRFFKTLFHVGKKHFFLHGGAMGASSDPGFLSRVKDLFWNFFVHGLGAEIPHTPATAVIALLWVAVIVLFAIQLKADPEKRRMAMWAALIFVPYLLWVVVAQNPEKPRHLMPIFPIATLLFGVAFAPTMERKKRGDGPGDAPLMQHKAERAMVTTLLVVTLVVAFIRVRTLHRTFPPSVELVRHVVVMAQKESVLVYANDLVRVFERLAPGIRVKRQIEGKKIVEDLQKSPHPKTVLLTPYAAKRVQGLLPLKEVKQFSRNPRLDPYQSDLTLYQWVKSP